MKKLFSIVILLFVLLAGVWVSVTYWFGLKTEEQYHSLLRQASQWQYFKIVNESYSRGLFESKARTVVEIDRPPGTSVDNQPIRLTLAQNIMHGPFPSTTTPGGKRLLKPVMATIETSPVLGPEAQSRLAELYAQIPELASVRDYTVIYLKGNGEEQLTIPPFQRTLGKEEKVAVDWQGLSLQVNFTADLKGFTGALSIPGLKAVTEDLNLRIEEVKCGFDSHEGISGLALGDASFEVGSLNIVARQDAEPRPKHPEMTSTA